MAAVMTRATQKRSGLNAGRTSGRVSTGTMLRARCRGQTAAADVASPAFCRFYLRAFGIAAVLGLHLWYWLWIAAGLWHFHVHPLW